MKTKRTQGIGQNRLVCGVGTNDAGYAVTSQETVDGEKRVTRHCPFYLTWRNMLERCYSKRPGKARATYSGCTVCPEWHRFSVFRRWMKAQGWEGKQLDKDILVENNRVYSPETCIFVSAQLNNFLTHSAKSSRKWPVGVSWHAGKGKFHSYCNNPLSGKPDFLGWFASPEEAHEAWRRRKHELACRYADIEPDPRLANALRSRFAVHNIQEAA